MNPEEHIPVRVTVGDQNLRLLVPRKKEEYVRIAANMVNKRMNEFKQFEVGEAKNRLAWAALDYTTDLAEMLTTKDQNQSDIYATLAEIEGMLNLY